MVQIEDMLDVLDQINIPSTTTQHPNWRRKLPIHLETWAADRRVVALVAAMRHERPRIRSNPKPARRLRIPLATYRLQLNQAFTFTQAAQIVPYLAQLGVSHVYCSPYLKARPVAVTVTTSSIITCLIPRLVARKHSIPLRSIACA